MLARRDREGRGVGGSDRFQPGTPTQLDRCSSRLGKAAFRGSVLGEVSAGRADADEAHPLRCRRHTSRILVVSAVLADRRLRVDQSVAVAVEQGLPRHAPVHRKAWADGRVRLARYAGSIVLWGSLAPLSSTRPRSHQQA